MKILTLSDIHTEFHDKEQLQMLIDLAPPADVLLIAGDTAEYRHYVTLKTRAVLDAAKAKYPNVLMVLGNHEFYGGDYSTVRSEAPRLIAAEWAPQIQLMDNKSVVIGDTVFIGSTLWSHLEEQHWFSISCMLNDYYHIKHHRKPITPEFTTEEFHRNKSWIEDQLRVFSDKKIVVMTHHAPSSKSISADSWKKYDDVNYAYFTNLSELILDNPSIKVWVHGHTHNVADYMVGDTRVVSNPVGYYLDAEEFKHKLFEV